jgi:hypothetical protein
MTNTTIALVLAGLCFMSPAAAQDVRSPLPHSHPLLKALGASAPISDRHAVCLAPVDDALISNLSLLTTLRPEDAKEAGTKSGIRFKPTRELTVEYRAAIEATDWASRPLAALRKDLQPAETRQREAHDTLVGAVLARGDNVLAGMKLDKRIRAIGKPGGDPESEYPRLESEIRGLEEYLEQLDDEILKFAMIARYADATVSYYDCELATAPQRGSSR